MGDKLTRQTNIPSWVIVTAATLLMTWMIFKITDIKAQQNTNTRVEILEVEMDKKALQSDVDRIYIKLDKIDDKLDKILTQHP